MVDILSELRYISFGIIICHRSPEEFIIYNFASHFQVFKIKLNRVAVQENKQFDNQLPKQGH